jgi:hypothetical protein
MGFDARWPERVLRRDSAPSKVGFAQDSPQEETGFEPLVPLATEMLIELARGILMQLGCSRSSTPGRCRGLFSLRGGTSGSNPVSSSGESANPLTVGEIAVVADTMEAVG